MDLWMLAEAGNLLGFHLEIGECWAHYALMSMLWVQRKSMEAVFLLYQNGGTA